MKKCNYKNCFDPEEVGCELGEPNYKNCEFACKEALDNCKNVKQEELDLALSFYFLKDNDAELETQ
jgi:hypothetical protein